MTSGTHALTLAQSAFEAVCKERDKAREQLEAMREAIKEAHEALKTAQRQWRHYAEFRDDDNLETATHHEGRLYRTGQAALAKLQPFIAA